VNNSTYRSSQLLGEIIRQAHMNAEYIAEYASIIDNFCDNMPDECVTYVYASRYAASFQVRGDGEVLTMAIRFLRTRGYKTDAAPPEKVAAVWEALFVHGEDLNQPRVRLTWASTVCKQVQVGTKMVEQPVYEIRCGEEPTPHDGVAAVDPPEGMPGAPDGDTNESTGSEVAPNEESAES
jgi:hypothetical protein